MKIKVLCTLIQMQGKQFRITMTPTEDSTNLVLTFLVDALYEYQVGKEYVVVVE